MLGPNRYKKFQISQLSSQLKSLREKCKNLSN